MPLTAWKLPWRDEMVPHAVLDILRGCNISCRACYNTCPPTRPKSLEEIEDELDALLRYRRLSSVSLAGGEVALHPDLAEIIALIRRKGLHVELISNGLAVDRAMMKNLAEAGLNIVYFHIERGQKRPDLPKDHTFADINTLRREKAGLAHSCKVDVGLTLTIYPGETEELQDTLAFFLASKEVNYLLITLFRDITSIEALQGDLATGLYGTGSPASGRRDVREVASWIEKTLHLKPFAFVGSNLDPNDPRWLSYLIAAVAEPDGRHHYQDMQAGPLEKLAMHYYKTVVKRYPMYMEQNANLLRKQLFLNGLFTGKFSANRELIRRSRRDSAVLNAKRLLIQNPAELTADGRLVHCRCCPDAVLKNGALVPVCIADKVTAHREPGVVQPDNL